jgi:hypothetical protein
VSVDINVLKDFLGVQAIELIQLRSEKVRLENTVAQTEPRIAELQQRIAELVHKDDPKDEQPAEPPVTEMSEEALKRIIEDGQAEYETNMAKVRRVAKRRTA